LSYGPSFSKLILTNSILLDFPNLLIFIFLFSIWDGSGRLEDFSPWVLYPFSFRKLAIIRNIHLCPWRDKGTAPALLRVWAVVCFGQGWRKGRLDFMRGGRSLV